MRVLLLFVFTILVSANTLNLSSEAFNKRVIPREFACIELGGKNISLPFSWSSQKGNLKFALIVDDETPPCGKRDKACIHWAIFNIPANVSTLIKNQNLKALSLQITQGKNYKNQIGYAGPCPPSKHLYKATLYLLKPQTPNIPDGAKFTRSSFEKRFKNFILKKETIKAYFTP